MPCQKSSSTPAKPASAIVGTAGSSAARSLRAHPQDAQFASLDLRASRQIGREQKIDAARNQILHGRSSAAIRHVHHGDTDLGPKHLRQKVAARADALRRVGKAT